MSLIWLILTHKESFDVTLVYEDSHSDQTHKVVLVIFCVLRTPSSTDKLWGAG